MSQREVQVAQKLGKSRDDQGGMDMEPHKVRLDCSVEVKPR